MLHTKTIGLIIIIKVSYTSFLNYIVTMKGFFIMNAFLVGELLVLNFFNFTNNIYLLPYIIIYIQIDLYQLLII